MSGLAKEEILVCGWGAGQSEGTYQQAEDKECESLGGGGCGWQASVWERILYEEREGPPLLGGSKGNNLFAMGLADCEEQLRE